MRVSEVQAERLRGQRCRESGPMVECVHTSFHDFALQRQKTHRLTVKREQNKTRELKPTFLQRTCSLILVETICRSERSRWTFALDFVITHDFVGGGLEIGRPVRENADRSHRSTATPARRAQTEELSKKQPATDEHMRV